MKRERSIVFTFILLLIIGTSGMLFSFWSNQIELPTNQPGDVDGDRVQIGSPRPVSMQVNLGSITRTSDGSTNIFYLVPYGTIDDSYAPGNPSNLGVGVATQIVFNFPVIWEEVAWTDGTYNLEDNQKGILSVFVSDVVVGDNHPVSHLVNFQSERVDPITLLPIGASIFDSNDWSPVVQGFGGQFTFPILMTNDNYDNTFNVRIRVSLSVPYDEIEYDYLANQTITFKVNFRVAAVS